MRKKWEQNSLLKRRVFLIFGSRTGIDLPNEGSGIIHTMDTMGETELACSAFGQGFTCTMLQEISAMCSVINGGLLLSAASCDCNQGQQRGTVRRIDPVLLKQTISSDISANIRSYMQASVQEGTSVHRRCRDTAQAVRPVQRRNFQRGNKKYYRFFYYFCTG